MLGHAVAGPPVFGHEKGRSVTPGRSVYVLLRRPSRQHYPLGSTVFTSSKKRGRPGWDGRCNYMKNPTGKAFERQPANAPHSRREALQSGAGF